MDLAGTWNTSGTPTAIKLNITDTASNGASLLMDLGTGGGSFVSRFRVNKSGVLTSASGGNSTPQIILSSNSGQGSALGNVNGGSNLIFFGNDNGIVGNWQQFVGIVSTGINCASIGGINWTNSSSNVATTTDLFLTRRGAANLRLGAADAAGSATVTITIATPGVVTWSGHGLSTGTPVIFSTTGALPTGITAGTTYYAIVVDTNTFRIATSLANALAGTAVNTSGSQSGTQTGSRGAIAQTSSVQSVVAGTTNFPGADKIITGSQGTGTGAGGSLIFQVAPAGSSGSAQNALATALTINSDRSITLGASLPIIVAPDTLRFDVAGVASFAVATTPGGLRNAQVPSFGQFAFSSTTNAAGTADTILARDAANTLALRNGVNAQTFRVYKTESSSLANYERLEMGYLSDLGVYGYSSGFAGTGTALSFYVGPRGDAPLYLMTNGTTRWQIGGTTGAFQASTDNTYDIGTNSSSRPKSIYAGTSITPGAGVAVASLPTPTTGMVARVTNALAPTVGATVAGGGAAQALVWYNGANWTVIGV
jgi:hypothetical protein